VNTRCLATAWALLSVACLLTRPLDPYGRDDSADGGGQEVPDAIAPLPGPCGGKALAFRKVADLASDPTGFAAAGEVAWVVTKSTLGRYDVAPEGSLATETRLASNLDNAFQVVLSPTLVLFQQTEPPPNRRVGMYKVPRDARAAVAPIQVRSYLSGPMAAAGERVFYSTATALALTLTSDRPEPGTSVSFNTASAPTLVTAGRGNVAIFAVPRGETGSAILTVPTAAPPGATPNVVVRTGDVAAIAVDDVRVVVADMTGGLASYPVTGGARTPIASGLAGARALALANGFVYVVTDSAVVRLKEADGCRESVPFVAREIQIDGAFVWATSGRAVYRAAIE